MLALLPLAAFLGLWLLLGNLRPQWGWRRSLLRAAALTGAYTMLITESLSLIRAISQLALVVGWGIPVVVSSGWLARLGTSRRRLALPQVSWPKQWVERVLLMGVAAILATTAVVAWLSPPNTYDSLNYHMARVAHWAQNRSLRPFATGIEWQNGNAPGAEIGVLQLYVLIGGDRLVNFVEWSAMAVSLVGVSLIAVHLGGGSLAQLLAVVLTASLPMGIAQASSTMTDYVVAAWAVCVASECLALVRRETRIDGVVFVSLAAGLALAAKPTSYAYLFPFALWACWALLRRFSPGQAIAMPGVAIALTLLLNAGHLARNLDLYGTPVGVPQLISVFANELRSPSALISNITKNAGMQAGTPWPAVNSLLFRAIASLHHVIGFDPNDPRTTSIGQFFIYPPRTSEAFAINWIHAWLYLVVLLLVLLRPKKEGTVLAVYALTAVAGFSLFSAVFKWQVFSARYHLPFFVLFAPAAATVLSGLFHPWLGRTVALLVLLGSWPYLVHLDERPLIPRPGTTVSVAAAPRDWLYLGEGAAGDYTAIATQIRDAGCLRVGVMFSGNGAEYPLWVFLGAPRSGVRLEWIVAGTPSARFADPEFEPCAAVCDQSCPEETTAIRDLPLRYETSRLRLFMESESTTPPTGTWP